MQVPVTLAARRNLQLLGMVLLKLLSPSVRVAAAGPDRDTTNHAVALDVCVAELRAETQAMGVVADILGGVDGGVATQGEELRTTRGGAAGTQPTLATLQGPESEPGPEPRVGVEVEEAAAAAAAAAAAHAIGHAAAEPESCTLSLRSSATSACGSGSDDEERHAARPAPNPRPALCGAHS